MPVSPADFEFYSRMTGQPIPNTPAGRMAIAPQVYNMRRGGGGFGRFVRGAAQGALAAGALAGAGALALATQEEMAKEGPKVKVTENMSGAESASPSVTTAPVQQQADKQYFVPSSDEERIGAPDAQKLREIAAFRNRISGQTLVPSASVQVANESVAAQRASTSMPTDPRVGVRQQPSSGMIVTDLSNVAQVEGRPAKETNPQLSAIRQQLEMYEGSPTQSPFQAGGAMEELRRQSMDVKKSVGDLPKSIRGDVAVFLSNLSGQTAAPAPTAARSAAKEIQQQLGRMSERDQVQYQGGLKGSAPQGVYGSLETSQDVMGDAPLGGLSSSKEMMRGMLERGNVLPSGIPQTRTNVPGPTDPITGDYRPFVSNKGREIGALLSQAQEKKAAAPVTLKEIAGDALNLLNPFKGKKVDPREQQIRSDVNRSLGALSPEQKEAEVQRRLGQ
tara:strand:+ start:530 stop:1870 length:1341 start_codon:yes stop_codon:yes gene_type:complete